MTAAEHEAWLRQTGQYEAIVRRQREEDESRAQRAAEWRRAEEPLVKELEGVGYVLSSVWDLVNTPGTYPKAVPILLAHLPRDYPDAVREGIARALAVPEAKIGWDVLTRLYRSEHAGRAKDGLAVAIAGACDDHVVGDVVGLARDKNNGPSRLLLLRALERSTDPRARAALNDLKTDPELSDEIRVILSRLNGVV